MTAAGPPHGPLTIPSRSPHGFGRSGGFQAVLSGAELGRFTRGLVLEASCSVPAVSGRPLGQRSGSARAGFVARGGEESLWLGF